MTMLKDPVLSTAVAAILEKTLNSALIYDPATRKKLASLSGHVLLVDCQSPKIELFFRILNEDLCVNSHFEGDADVVVSGTVGDFLTVLGEPYHSLANANISVSGKVNILNQIKIMLSDVDIDWEDMLSEVTGVIPAHFAAMTFKSAKGWFNFQKKTFEAHLPEYLSEELKAVPSAAELQDYYDGVDEVKSSAQRLKARIQQFSTKLGKIDNNLPTNSKNS